jgi:UDP-glucose 4-epimerase
MPPRLSNLKCIVFGSNGYIGRHLVQFLIQAGNSVQALDIQDSSIISNISYRTVNVATPDSLRDIDWDVDSIFLFSGITGTYESFNNYQQFVTINELGLLNILTDIRNSRSRPRIIFPSTRLVYEGSDIPLKEVDAKKPKTIYAVNKIACESLLEIYGNTFDIPFTIYRICVPYGNIIGSEYSYGTVGSLLKQAKTQAVIKLYGDGSLRRTFTHVEDICRQIISSCSDEGSLNETFNIAGEAYSLRDISSLIADKYGARLVFTEWPENDRRIESGHTVFNAEKLFSRYHLALKRRFPDWINRLEL